MRRTHRWPIKLGLLFAALLFLLLLSALVESPADQAADLPQAPIFASIQMPMTLPTPEAAVQADRMVSVRLPLLLALFVLMFPLLVADADANGRVLRRKRYVDCFYPVFQQERACG